MNRPSLLLTTAMSAAALGAAGCSSMNSSMGAGPSSAAEVRLPAADVTFATTAAGNGMYEVEVSRMAAGKATNPRVKDFANMLVQHHTMANNELLGIMRGKGITPPASLPPDKQAKIAQLSRLSGAEFDREYMRITGVQDHQTDITLFDSASRTLQDPALKGFAAKTLPVLRQHLQSAQGILGTLAG
ncbi:DUF4142 domain-containing protein [Ramlibacter terrae]|uniref:DUF4142 domain-containing protein n=1 Tax=Ramlibacter terrae TaxID=2732511 RepID=A0ABX6P389_9BURK|nr:DUF4142 domain-containing protein [Ramlibacter terrae]